MYQVPRRCKNNQSAVTFPPRSAFRRSRSFPPNCNSTTNQLAKMPINWHFQKRTYCTSSWQTNHMTRIRTASGAIIYNLCMCQVFGSGSNSTYTVSIMPAVGPGTHGTIFFGIYSKNRADQCPRVCLQRCNRSPFKIPKHDNTPPYAKFK